jgi:hypothetical protein
VVILGFSLPQANQFDFFRLQAMVVHQVAGGAGLIFDNLEADVVRAFRSALYEDVAPAHALESWESTRAA